MDVIDQVVKRAIKDRSVKVYVGIDPGSNGAVGFVIGSRAYAISLPTMKVEKGKAHKTEFAYPTIVGTFKRMKFCRHRTRVALEEPQVFGRAGAFSAMRQGANFGMWPLFLAASELSYEILNPRTWKRAMGVDKNKTKCRMIAMQLFPNLDVSKKKDDGRAEAVLMAECLRRKHGAS